MKQWLYDLIKKKYQISIIIPTYKNVEFLNECISSVISSAEKVCEFELLIGIDNCSETLKLVGCDSIFKNKNIRIYYFSKNVGPYVIRNSLANKAKYHNVLFFDSDDVMMKSTVSTLMEKFCNTELLKFKFYNFENNDGYKDISKLALSKIYSHGVFLIKKEKFLSMNGFFGWKCGADAEFHERYEGQNNSIELLDIPLYYRRYHDKNITRLPDTGLYSKLRQRYEKIIFNNRINSEWNNPTDLEVFPTYLISI